MSRQTIVFFPRDTPFVTSLSCVRGKEYGNVWGWGRRGEKGCRFPGLLCNKVLGADGDGANEGTLPTLGPCPVPLVILTHSLSHFHSFLPRVCVSV